MIESRTVHPGKIALTDYLSLILSLLSLMGVLLGPFVLLLWLGTIPLLVWRVGRIKRTLETGTTVEGVIIEKRFLRGEWRVRYAFPVQGQAVEVGNYVVGFRLPFNRGDRVAVAYDPSQPTTAFLPDVYRQGGLPGWLGWALVGIIGSAALCVTLVGIGGILASRATPPAERGVTLPYTDDFSDPASGWRSFETADTATGYESGEYVVRASQPRVYTVGLYATQPFSDTILSVQARVAEGGAEQVQGGLVCRSDRETRTFYSFLLTPAGEYAIVKTVDGIPTTLTGGGQLARTDAVGNPDVPQELSAHCVGDTLTFYVNGQQVDEAKDSEIAAGFVGVRGGTFEAPAAEIHYDDFTIAAP